MLVDEGCCSAAAGGGSWSEALRGRHSPHHPCAAGSPPRSPEPGSGWCWSEPRSSGWSSGPERWPSCCLRRSGARWIPHLEALAAKELIRPGGTSFAGEQALRFAHLLIRDAAYEQMLKETRAELHERFVAWLERRADARAVQYEEIIGYHLEQALPVPRGPRTGG